MKQSDFINTRLNGQETEIPQLLYKYRPFDQYAFGMLEDEQLFLCKAKNLDDPSECTATLTPKDYYDLKTGQLSYRVVDGILEYLRPYYSETNYEEMRSHVYKTIAPDGYVKRNYLLDASFIMQDLAPTIDIAPFINFLGNIPEKMQEPEMGKAIETLLSLAVNAREDMGICSLSELSDSAEMWEKYADKSSGYCIEYDMKDYKQSLDVFPVVYSDNRNTDILSAIIGGFLGKFIFGMTNGQIDADKSQYFRLFLTKNTIWQYQKEWRILGNANEEIQAPNIKAIYLGKNASTENTCKMKQFCEEHHIPLIQH